MNEWRLNCLLFRCSTVSTVDASTAGSGELRVEVLYMGQAVPSQIIPNGQDYNVNFNPVGPGSYEIHVYYANIEVAGTVA